MGIKNNAAFVGTHSRDGLPPFEISYLNRAALAPLNLGTPRGHHRYRRVGWYWHTDWQLVGPFTSSRAAYQDAMAWKPKHVRVA